jgi:hypothetical protein
MAKKKTTARKGKRSKRPEFKATMPKGLSPAQQKAWESAAMENQGSWQPTEQGEHITGKLLSSSEEKGKYGEQRVLHIETAEGVRKVYCSTVLESEFQRVQPTNGQHVLILFKGTYSTGRGRPAKLFGLSIVEGKKGGR